MAVTFKVLKMFKNEAFVLLTGESEHGYRCGYVLIKWLNF